MCMCSQGVVGDVRASRCSDIELSFAPSSISSAAVSGWAELCSMQLIESVALSSYLSFCFSLSDKEFLSLY